MSYQHSKFLMPQFEDHTTSAHDTFVPLGDGYVKGPILSANNAITRYDGLTGKIVKDSNVFLDDYRNIYNVNLLETSSIIINNTLNGTATSLQTQATSSYSIDFPPQIGLPNQVLKTNGFGMLDWTTPISGAAGQVLYFNRSIVSGVASYYELGNIVSGAVENIANYSVTGLNQYLDGFITPLGFPNAIFIPNGIIELNMWASVSSTAGDNTLRFDFYKRTQGGVETLLASSIDSVDISSTSTAAPQLLTFNVAIVNFDILATDRLLIKLYGSASIPSKTISVNFEGITHYSHMHSTLTGIEDIQATIDALGLVAVTNPSVTSTTNAIPKFTDTSGITIQNSGVLIDGSNNITGVTSITTPSINTPSTSLTLIAVGNSVVVNATEFQVEQNFWTLGDSLMDGNLTMRTTTGAFTPPKLTTTQRDALTKVDGKQIYNTTTQALNICSNNRWIVPGGDYFQPISEFISATVPMTSAVLPAPYVVIASSSADTARAAWKLFDQVLTTSWISGTSLYGFYNGIYAIDTTGTGLTGITQTGAYNTIALPVATQVSKYRMYPRADTGTVTNGHPYEWNLVYSMDNVTWASAHFVTGQPNAWGNYIEFDITPVTAPYWGIQINKASGTSATTFAGFGELRLYDTLMISTTTSGVFLGALNAPTEIGGNLTVIGDTRISTKTPASATATGIVGTIAYDDDYIYICIDTDVWKRSYISTWP